MKWFVVVSIMVLVLHLTHACVLLDGLVMTAQFQFVNRLVIITATAHYQTHVPVRGAGQDTTVALQCALRSVRMVANA